MKKIGLAFLAVVITMSGVMSAGAQDSSVSAEKTALIKEMIEISNIKQNFKEMMSNMTSMQRKQSKDMMNDLISGYKTLTRAEKAEITEMANETVERILSRSEEFFATKFNFDRFVDEAYVPIYAKHFTEDELRDMIAFYHTSTGQKTIKEMPRLMADAMIAVSEKLLPDFMKFIKQTTDEEMTALKQKLPKKKITRKT